MLKYKTKNYDLHKNRTFVQFAKRKSFSSINTSTKYNLKI